MKKTFPGHISPQVDKGRSEMEQRQDPETPDGGVVKQGADPVEAYSPKGISGLSKVHTFSRQIWITVIATILLAIVPVLFIGAWAMSEVDALAEVREQTLLARALEDEKAQIAQEQQSVTVWDDAYLATRRDDQIWMEENLGVWLHDFYGHDQAFVLDAADKPVHAMIDGKTVPPRTFNAEKGEILPLVRDLRNEVAEADDPGEAGVVDFLRVAGHPAIVSIRAIVPDTDRLSYEPEDVYVHVVLRYLDSDLLPRIGKRNLIHKLGFVTKGQPLPKGTWLPVTSKQQGVLGHVVWERERPGLAVMRRVAPGTMAAALVLLGLIAWLIGNLRGAIREVHESRIEIQHLAFHDTLTGLPNRNLFNDRLGQAIAEVRRGRNRVALLYIDLDRFKNVNDTLGHPAGDELIRQVAERLAAVVRETDTVARLGGDEFVVIQTGVKSRRDPEILAERIMETIQKPFLLHADQAFVGSSIGIALAPDSTRDGRELLRMADIALYQAKSGGKGRLCVFEDSFDDIVRRKRSVERDLRTALHGGQGLALLYQPLFATDGVTLRGAEALFRWNHPLHGELPPQVLIGIAEERGLGGELGAWILRDACRTALATALPLVSVNVSPQQCADPDFADAVLGILAEVGLPARRLQLEIAENTLIEADDVVAAAISRLRGEGVSIALDEFGAGYSLLRYLHRFRVDRIKIDRTFIQNMGAGRDNDAMMRVMFDLADALGIEVVAEGVETDGQWQMLAQLGSPDLQGFFFSRPVDAAELARIVQRAPGGAVRRA